MQKSRHTAPCSDKSNIATSTTTQTVSGTTDYLIIGCIGSTDWIHTCYGRKIEKAKQWQQTKKTDSS